MAAPGTAAYNAKQARRYQKRAQQQANIAGTIGSLGILAQGLGSYAQQRREQEYLGQMQALMAGQGMGGPQAPAHAPPMALYDQPQGPMTATGQPPVAMGEAAQIPMAPPQGNPYAGTLSEMAGMRVPPRQASTHFGVMGQLRQNSQEWDRNKRMGDLYRRYMGSENPVGAYEQDIGSGLAPFDQGMQTALHNATQNARATQDRAEDQRGQALGQEAMSVLSRRMAAGRRGGGFMRAVYPFLPEDQRDEMTSMYDSFDKVRKGIQDEREDRDALDIATGRKSPNDAMNQDALVKGLTGLNMMNQGSGGSTPATEVTNRVRSRVNSGESLDIIRGTDPQAWDSLSPREQAKMMDMAESFAEKHERRKNSNASNTASTMREKRLAMPRTKDQYLADAAKMEDVDPELARDLRNLANATDPEKERHYRRVTDQYLRARAKELHEENSVNLSSNGLPNGRKVARFIAEYEMDGIPDDLDGIRMVTDEGVMTPEAVQAILLASGIPEKFYDSRFLDYSKGPSELVESMRALLQGFPGKRAFAVQQAMEQAMERQAMEAEQAGAQDQQAQGMRALGLR